MRRKEGCVFLWKWKWKGGELRDVWELAEYYATDDDFNGDVNDTSIEEWLHSNADDANAAELIPIEGRVVVLFDFWHGIRLHQINPISEIPWLRTWGKKFEFNELTNGETILFRSMELAKDLLLGEEK